MIWLSSRNLKINNMINKVNSDLQSLRCGKRPIENKLWFRMNREAKEVRVKNNKWRELLNE